MKNGGKNYFIGLTLIAVGIVGALGSFTGSLASMLAALWDPNALSSVPGTGGTTNAGGTQTSGPLTGVNLTPVSGGGYKISG